MAVMALACLFAVLVAACGGGGGSDDSAEQPPMPRGALAKDAQILQGRNVFGAYCATCHGFAGGGGVGPSFADGKLLKDFSDAKTQEALVKMGEGAMPAFSSQGDARVEAVVRYEREVLSKQGNEPRTRVGPVRVARPNPRWIQPDSNRRQEPSVTS